MDETKTLDGSGALVTQAGAPFSAASALGDLEAAARALGRNKRLECSDGTWLCWGCGGETEFHVSLHCAFCLAEHEKTKARRKHERRMEQMKTWATTATTFAAQAAPDEGEVWERG